MMKKLFILTSILVAITFVNASATIINVPADYDTIQEGIDASVDGDTVLVQPGTYVENINFNGHNIVLGSLFLTTGDTSYISSTIIDGDSSGSVVTFNSDEDSTAVIIGFTIQNGLFFEGGGIVCHNSSPMITNNIISGNCASFYGGGISCYSSSPMITNNIISGNSANEEGGGIDCYVSNPTITNNIISGNSAATGGGISCYENSSPTITNNTISENLANEEGGGIFCLYQSSPVITNTIFWGDSAPNGPEIYLEYWSSPVITYCDVQDGWPGEGNIDTDPMFVDPENGDFHLQAGSPCIDAGDPDSPLDPDGTIADIGAFYFDQTVGIDDLVNIPIRLHLFQNYPNPFNTSTTISYSLPRPSDVTLDVYDILGRKGETLQDGAQPAGYHQTIWNADEFSTGVYFYKLQAGDYTQTKKMVLLK